MPKNPSVLMIIGAATPPGRLAASVSFAADLLHRKHPDIAVEVLNLADARIETCDGRLLAAYDDATRRAVAQIASAAAVLIGAPVYRASFPGVLKNLLDIVPVEALQGKPVGIIAMGGSPHHYLAVDTQLRQVLAWFGALLAPTCVYLTSGDFTDGLLTSEAARSDLLALTDTLTTLLERLDRTSLGPIPLAAKFT
jgi:FMN reductase